MQISKIRKSIFAHLETCRPYTVLYIGFVGLIGASISGPSNIFNLICAWFVPTFGWVGSLYGSDYFDRDLDQFSKPQRPIPSGRIRPITALLVMCFIIVVGAVFSLLINFHTIVLVIAATIIGILYSTVGKKYGLFGNILRGVMTILALLYGSMMVLPWPNIKLIPVAMAFALLDTASNLMGSIRDIEGDRKFGYYSFAAVRGIKPSLTLIIIFEFFAFTIVLIEIFNLSKGYISIYLSLALLCLFLIFIAVAVISVWKAKNNHRFVSYRAHTWMVLARILFSGSLLIVVFGFGATWLVAFAFLATYFTQKYLRYRHEFSKNEEFSVSKNDIENFIDKALDALNMQAKIHNWDRAIKVNLTDINLIIYLNIENGNIRRVYEFISTDIDIETTSRVFSDIFLTKTSSPRIEYFAGRMILKCKSIDMIRLSQLFRNFIQENRCYVISEGQDKKDVEELSVIVSDTTLRDGEQMPGIRFSKSVKVELAKLLNLAGIPLIEAGFPIVSDEEFDSIRQIVDTCPDSVIQAIARPRRQDIQAALDTGAGSIAIFIGTSPIHLGMKLNMTFDELLFAIEREVQFASVNGRQVVFTAEDATRTPIEDLLRVFEVAAHAGAHSLGIADTVGVAFPDTFSELVKSVVNFTTLPVAVHCHNDIGLATANSIAGIQAGANGVQCSVLGIGERAGNAPLEQVLVGLQMLGKYRTGVDMKSLLPLAQFVSDHVGVTIPPSMPIIGQNAFTHESGLHVDGILGDSRTYEPYSPDLIGRTRHIVLGKHSGARAVRKVAQDLGVNLNEGDVRKVLSYIKANDTGALSADKALLSAITSIGIHNSK